MTEQEKELVYLVKELRGLVLEKSVGQMLANGSAAALGLTIAILPVGTVLTVMGLLLTVVNTYLVVKELMFYGRTRGH